MRNCALLTLLARHPARFDTLLARIQRVSTLCSRASSALRHSARAHPARFDTLLARQTARFDTTLGGDQG